MTTPAGRVSESRRYVFDAGSSAVRSASGHGEHDHGRGHGRDQRTDTDHHQRGDEGVAGHDAAHGRRHYMITRSRGEHVGPVRAGDFEALVFVTMKQEDRATLRAFEEATAAIPNVLLAQRLFGDPDYLLRVRTTDLDAYARLEDDVLSTLPGVQRLNSTLVMKSFVLDRPYPTDLA